MRWRLAWAGVAAGVALLVAPSTATAHRPHGRIRHVVIVYQENHSFDNVLGRLCVRTGRCDGSRFGRLADGSRRRLATSSDFVPPTGHTTQAQLRAIDGGRMDGWQSVNGCSAEKDYACLTQYSPRQIPNLAHLARHFALSDRTFQMDSVPSWGAHLELVAATLDGFLGDRAPKATGVRGRRGWGCDSRKEASWSPSPGGAISPQPSCVPDYSLDPARYPFGGAYRRTEVRHVPTLMDELDRRGLSWKLYTAARPASSGYGWAICPTFADCLYTQQHNRQVGHRRVLKDARRGNLPNFSVVLPSGEASQHNQNSMAVGDNWIGRVVQAIEDGSDWRSTAIFVTYDDCGCFYDHVPPPQGLGIRTPMVMVSPWVKRHTTDARQASIASMLAFTERTFDLPALTQLDSSAYDYEHAFDFHQRPVTRVRMTQTQVRRAELERIARHGEPPGAT